MRTRNRLTTRSPLNTDNTGKLYLLLQQETALYQKSPGKRHGRYFDGKVATSISVL